MNKYAAAFSNIKSKPQPLLQPDGTLHQFTLHIAGKAYRCTCKCNVFHKPDRMNLDLYECNPCGQHFEATNGR